MKTQLVYGDAVYPNTRLFKNKMFYVCWSCDARVGCHKGTSNPLGNLANADLRAKRTKAHKAFDMIWSEKYMARKDAYKWLSKKMNLNIKDCHIAMMSLAECERVIDLSYAYVALQNSIKEQKCP